MHLKAKQYWLVPELVDDERVVFDVLGFSAADAEEEANVLILTRPGVRRREIYVLWSTKGDGDGLGRVANFDGT